MFGLLALLILVVPIVELYVIVQVAQGFGIVTTIVLLIAVSAVGAWLCKREGLGLLNRLQRELSEGKVPTRTVTDGFLVLLAGALLLTPGFVTDLVAVGLLLPPVRAVVRAVLLRRFTSRVATVATTTATTAGPADDRRRGSRAERAGGNVYDVRSTSRDDEASSSDSTPPADASASDPPSRRP